MMSDKSNDYEFFKIDMKNAISSEFNMEASYKQNQEVQKWIEHCIEYNPNYEERTGYTLKSLIPMYEEDGTLTQGIIILEKEKTTPVNFYGIDELEEKVFYFNDARLRYIQVGNEISFDGYVFTVENISYDLDDSSISVYIEEVQEDDEK